MLTTTNYNFKKPELIDSPPDITTTNPNWDLVDINLKDAQDKASAWDTIKKNGGIIGDITIGDLIGTNSLMPNKEKYLGSNEKRWEGIKIKNGSAYGANEDFVFEALPDKSVLLSTNRSSDNRQGNVVLINNDSELCFRPTGGTGAGKVDIGNPTVPFKDIYIGEYSTSPNGYTKLPNGLILQWARVSFASGSFIDKVVYPIAFPNRCLQLVISPGYCGGGVGYVIAYNTTGATSFSCKANSTTVTEAFYIAIGI